MCCASRRLVFLLAACATRTSEGIILSARGAVNDRHDVKHEQFEDDDSMSPSVMIADRNDWRSNVIGGRLQVEKPKDYVQIDYGTDGCPAGTEIKTAALCWEAVSKLGIKYTKWTGSVESIPRFCSIRVTGEGTGKYSNDPTYAHFNTGIEGTGRGRTDLAPVCKVPAPLPAPAPAPRPDPPAGADEADKKETKQEENTSGAKKPHILFILLDDLGWSDVAFNVDAKQKEYTLNTPEINALAEQGAVLKRHYVHKFCGPTRSAIQSGRAPIHVNVLNSHPQVYNEKDKEGGFSGIPRAMTGMAYLMRKGGYKTHMVGKWDAGMATPEHTPAGRGYDTSLIYFNHENGRWDSKLNTKCSKGEPDLWEHGASIPYPGRLATGKLNPAHCDFEHQEKDCIYEDEMFAERVLTIIEEHDPDDPLFMFWATAAVHGPYEPPESHHLRLKSLVHETTNHVWQNFLIPRTRYFGMLSFIDEAIGRVVKTLRQKGSMYDDTLIVFSSDNGAVAGMNNEPLKGAKHSNWEGGIRAATFVSGGFLPHSQHGTEIDGLVAAWDWYATFAAFAGVDTEDKNAAAKGLPPVDSINVWSLISGQTSTSPRQTLEIGSTRGGLNRTAELAGEPILGGLIKQYNDKLYKLVLGDAPGNRLECALTFGPTACGRACEGAGAGDAMCAKTSEVCSDKPETGCLFELYSDPSEQKSVAAKEEKIFHEMLGQMNEIGLTVYAPDRGDDACYAFKHYEPSLLMSRSSA